MVDIEMGVFLMNKAIWTPTSVSLLPSINVEFSALVDDEWGTQELLRWFSAQMPETP